MSIKGERVRSETGIPCSMVFIIPMKGDGREFTIEPNLNVRDLKSSNEKDREEITNTSRRGAGDHSLGGTN